MLEVRTRLYNNEVIKLKPLLPTEVYTRGVHPIGGMKQKSSF